MISSKSPEEASRIVVLGVGYVGLPLAVELALAGHHVTAYDTDESKVRKIGLGESYIQDVASEQVARAVALGRLRATAEPDILGQADVAIVCVPTPLGENRSPDLSHVLAALDTIAQHQRPQTLIVIESTGYPGMTREIAVPRLTGERFQLGRDVFVAFSPERLDPGNPAFSLKSTPKVVAGATPACLRRLTSLYSGVFEHLVPVSSTDTAEMVKLLENTFRAVNIGLVNEFAILARGLGIDPIEVTRAAATKPFGFMAFSPGPGLGGHCIPVDPLYLNWKLASMQEEAKLVSAADAVNSAMPFYVVGRLEKLLVRGGTAITGAHILIYGVAYKPNVADTRESPALTVIRELRSRGARIKYMDPLVHAVHVDGLAVSSVRSDVDFGDFDAVVIITDHAVLPKRRIASEAKLILDTRGALWDHGPKENLFGL